MYSGASADGECPLVIDSSTPSCGNSRFGCWVCTMVTEDMYIAICSIYLLIQMPQNSRITPHIIASFHDATRFGIALNGSIKVVRNKVRVLGNIRELHKLNTLVQLIPLSEYATTYGISVLAYLTKGTSQSVARILHSGRCVLANNSIVMDGHFKAPIDIVPRGVNLGILLLIIEQEMMVIPIFSIASRRRSCTGVN